MMKFMFDEKWIPEKWEIETGDIHPLALLR